MHGKRSSTGYSVVSAALANERLGTVPIAFFVLSAAAPLTAIGGIVPTGYATTGVIGIPLAFLLVGVVLAVFSVGYNAMARRISNAGAFYAYVSHGLGKPLGVSAAWVALLSYNLLQLGLYGAFGAVTAPLLNPLLGTQLPWWVYAFASWVIVTVLGLLRVDVNSRVLSILLCLEATLILVFDVADLAHPASGHISFATLMPDQLFVPGIGALLAIAVTGFVGFEAAPVFAEEARDARRTVPAATYLCLGVIALLYSFSSWAMTVATGPDKIAQFAGSNGAETVFVLAAQRLGPAFTDIGHALFATSLIAAMISYHNSVARYTFALGRERVLPAWFGRTSRSGAPKYGSLFQSALGLVVITAYAILQLDPLVQLFYWLGTSGGFGILVLLGTTSFAVIGYFRLHPVETFWSGFAAPALSLLAMIGIVELVVANFATLLGVEPDSPLRWIFPGSFAVVAVLGIGWALILRVARPDIYRGIGLGANSVTGRRMSDEMSLQSGQFRQVGA
ncbi:MAG: APC family permease [Kutzneria sp.]|nr:APC family permease [Kutzneria sp.]